MALVIILILVVASALNVLGRGCGIHFGIIVQSGILLIILSLADPANLSVLDGGKLALNGSVAFNSSLLLGGLIVGACALFVFSTHLDSRTQNETLAVASVSLAVAGLTLIATQSPALTITVLELQAYSAYILTSLGSFKWSRPSSSLIYFFAGAVATGLIMIGWGLTNGVGSLSGSFQPAYFSAGEAAQVTGFMIKLAGAPFHLWLPIAYNGLELFSLLAVSILSFVTLVFRLAEVILVSLPVVTALAVLSVVVGGIISSATTQTKRLLALSGTAHFGYVLSGITFILWPLVIYVLVYAAASVQVGSALMANPSRVLRLVGIRGGIDAFPLQGSSFFVANLSLGGVPFFTGFFTKAYILGQGISCVNLAFPFILMLSGCFGILAYLRLSLATVGYTQTRTETVSANNISGITAGSVKALTLGILVFPQVVGLVSTHLFY